MNFLHMAWIDFKGQRAAFRLEEFLLLETLYPLLTLIFYCVMAGYAYGTTDVSNWVVGNAFLLCSNICLFSLGTCFSGERYSGRIRSIICAPLSKVIIILEKGFFSAVVGVITTFLGFMVGCFIFHVSWEDIPWIVLVGIFVVAMFTATAFGMFLGVFGLLSDQIHLILNMAQCILLIFTGTNFPVSQLPAKVQILSYVLPLTRSISASRLILRGQEYKTIIRLVMGEAMLGVLYFMLAALLVKGVEKISIKRGKMELF